MSEMQQDFVFVDGGRTFTCRVEAPRRAGADAWWWFQVSTEQHQHQRHAPFRAVADDTCADVQARVVAYYDDLLARRAAPRLSRWGGRPAATPAAGAPADVSIVATIDAAIDAPTDVLPADAAARP